MKHSPLARLISTGSASAMLALAFASNAAPAAAYSADVQVSGTVTSFDGKYDLRIRDANGAEDDIQLHSGTIINPTGLALEDGMTLTILGAPDGDVIDANEIDAPYQQEEPANDSGGLYVDSYYPYAYGSYGNYVYGGYPNGTYGGNGYSNGTRPVTSTPRVTTVAPAHEIAPSGRRAPFSAPPSPVRAQAPSGSRR